MLGAMRRGQSEKLLRPATALSGPVEKVVATGPIECAVSGEMKLGPALTSDASSARQAQQGDATRGGALLHGVAFRADEPVLLRAAVVHMLESVNLTPRAPLVPPGASNRLVPRSLLV